MIKWYELIIDPESFEVRDILLSFQYNHKDCVYFKKVAHKLDDQWTGQ